MKTKRVQTTRNTPGTNTLSLAEVVERIGSGRQDLWPILLELLTPTVRTTLARYNVEDHLRRDAEAETWRVLFERLDSVEHPEKLRSWISVVASNRLMDMLRRPEHRLATAALDEEQLSNPPSDEHERLDTEVKIALIAAVARLSPREQTVVKARILTDEPIPLKEIERRFCIPQGSIGPTLTRSVAKLRTDPDLSQELRRWQPDLVAPIHCLAG